jgi:hypothetical protein
VLRNERGIDRRRAPRRLAERDEPLSRVRLRAGRDLAVVDISDIGLLVEGTMRLLPGSCVDVHLVTRQGRVLVRSRVVRAHVRRLSGSDIQYAGALAFEQSVDTTPVGYVVPSADPGASATQGKAYPDRMDSVAKTAGSGVQDPALATGAKVAPPLE